MNRARIVNGTHLPRCRAGSQRGPGCHHGRADADGTAHCAGLARGVLAAHPAVVAAEREVAATWEPIAVAWAERLPRFDLAAAISGQWLRAGGSTLDITTWALTPTLRRRSSTEVPAPRRSKARRRGFGLR